MRGFEAAHQTFAERDYGSRQAAREAAREWAERTRRELREQKANCGGGRRDTTTVRVRELVKHYLDDPNVKNLRTLDEVERMLCVWASEHGDERVRAYGRPRLTAFRNLLLDRGLSPSRANRYLSCIRRTWHWVTVAIWNEQFGVFDDWGSGFARCYGSS